MQNFLSALMGTGTRWVFCAGALWACDDATERPGQGTDCRTGVPDCFATQACVEHDGVFACRKRCHADDECSRGEACDPELQVCLPTTVGPTDDMGVAEDLCRGRGPECCVFDVQGTPTRGTCQLGVCTDGAASADHDDCVAEAGSLVFDPAELVFSGGGADDFPRQKSLLVSHRGEAPVVIESMRIAGWEVCDRPAAGLGALDPLPPELADCRFLIDERPALPATIASGEAVTFSIGYIPGEPAPNPTTLDVVTDGGRVQARLSVSSDPRFGVNPSGLTISGASEQGFLVLNTGAGTLEVTSVTLSLRSDPAAGGATELTATPETALPWILGPEESARLTVSYTPVDDLPDVADIVFESNDPVQPRVTAVVRANP